MNIQYDIYGKQIIIPTGETMPVEEFKQMCFENGWEGALFQVNAIERSMAESFNKVYLPKFGKFLKEQDYV